MKERKRRVGRRNRKEEGRNGMWDVTKEREERKGEGELEREIDRQTDR